MWPDFDNPVVAGLMVLCCICPFHSEVNQASEGFSSESLLTSGMRKSSSSTSNEIGT